jgi:hypothetical protein
MANEKGIVVQGRSGSRREDGETLGDPRGLRFSDSLLRYRPLNLDHNMPAYWFGATFVHKRNDGMVLFSFVLFCPFVSYLNKI